MANGGMGVVVYFLDIFGKNIMFPASGHIVNKALPINWKFLGQRRFWQRHSLL
jgi:hypothetical protein